MTYLKIPISSAWQKLNLDNLLRDQFHLGKKTRHQLRMSRDVHINGEPYSNWQQPLLPGTLLELPILEKQILPQSKKKIEIIYEDDFILLINKPAGLKTHPNSKDESDSCQHRVSGYLAKNKQVGGAFPIHRLDEATSGLLLFAKNQIALAAFSYQLEQRHIHREYVAMVDNILTCKKTMTIQKAIGSDRHHPNKRRISANGQTAITHVTVLACHPEKNYTYLKCQLDTGRTHQIRVHLSDAGFPIIGDTLYGGSNRSARMLLHARKLTCYHPFLAKELSFELPPDDSFQLLQNY